MILHFCRKTNLVRMYAAKWRKTGQSYVMASAPQKKE